MAVATTKSDSPRHHRRILVRVFLVSAIVCGMVDWLTEPHDVVRTKLLVVDGQVVEVDGKPVAEATDSIPNSLANRLALTILNGVIGGLLTTFFAWAFLRLRCRMRTVTNVTSATATTMTE